jgi:hypothetical protein
MGFFESFVGVSFLTGSMIYTQLQKARTKKEIQSIYQQASDTNFHNRSVAVLPNTNKQQLLLISGDPSDNDIYDYQTKSSIPALDYIWGENDNPDGVVVSGGQNESRVRALMPFVRKTQNKGIPLIAIHSGNRKLEEMLDIESSSHEFISRCGFYYDVFRGMPVEDMAYLLYETMPEDFAKPSSEALLRSLLEMVLRTKGAVTFQNLADFPLHELKDKLNIMQIAGEVSAEEYREINHYFMTGSVEIDSVRVFLSRLKRQAEVAFGSSTPNSCNIKKMLNNKGIIALDLGMVNNELLFSFVFNHLMLLLSKGRNFSIILDDIPLSRYPKVIDLLRGRAYAISHNDFVSSLYGGVGRGEDMFSEITGGVSTIVLLSHPSGTSCQKWSEHLGKYQKIRIRYNIAQSSAFLNSGDTRGITVDETDEPRIRAETLGRLPSSLACIHNCKGTLIAEV